MSKVREIYRWNGTPGSNSRGVQYQIQKQIQRVVRVPQSLYSMNLAALSVYQKPIPTTEVVDVNGTPYIAGGNVNWNQMSDRKQPHIQTLVTASGSTYGASSTRHTTVKMRPGAMSPGGAGVDIKHNSYDRYLNRLKGKAPLRRGPINPTFGIPRPFDPAHPVYGNKVMKLGIVNGCDCPTPLEDEKILYEDDCVYAYRNTLQTSFYVGQKVWVHVYDTNSCKQFLAEAGFPDKGICGNYYEGIVLANNDPLITVKLVEKDEIKVVEFTDLSLTKIPDCSCASLEEKYIVTESQGLIATCNFINQVSQPYVIHT